MREADGQQETTHVRLAAHPRPDVAIMTTATYLHVNPIIPVPVPTYIVIKRQIIANIGTNY